MSMLSTLGGAYSCVGDKGSTKHARIAGRIAVDQLKLACILGDDLLKLYALIYMAYSFLQQKMFGRSCITAAKIIKLYSDENFFRGRDQRLENMLTYLWTRLKLRVEKKMSTNLVLKMSYHDRTERYSLESKLQNFQILNAFVHRCVLQNKS